MTITLNPANLDLTNQAETTLVAEVEHTSEQGVRLYLDSVVLTSGVESVTDISAAPVLRTTVTASMSLTEGAHLWEVAVYDATIVPPDPDEIERIGHAIIADFTAPNAPTVQAMQVDHASPVVIGTLDSAETVAFSVTINGSTFTAGVDAALSVFGSYWTLDLAAAGLALPEGRYAVSMTATDAAGNNAEVTTENAVTIQLMPAPYYAQASDMIVAFGLREMVEIADHDEDGEPEEAVMEAALLQADGLIDSLLTRRAETVTTILTRCAIDIARWYLWDQAPMVMDTAGQKHAVRMRYEDAINYLRGSLKDGAPDTGGTVAVRSRRQHFSEAIMDRML